jgi:hypothetical protein
LWPIATLSVVQGHIRFPVQSDRDMAAAITVKLLTRDEARRAER